MYPGADAHFTLYEDEGDGYNYESGASTEIELTWHDATRTLDISDRKGLFPGMPATRKFRIVMVDTKKESAIPHPQARTGRSPTKADR
ncbi:DUF5110 domain-containing protein [Puia sp. P3]|uniref:DUF5110 domain-containing protein n=1 Tax=Puia sp. P3 TaxID=3423952 RepID=UPI003D67CECC